MLSSQGRRDHRAENKERTPNTAAFMVERAARGVVEPLEQRVMLAAHPHEVGGAKITPVTHVERASARPAAERGTGRRSLEPADSTLQLETLADTAAPVLTTANSAKEHGAGSGRWYSAPVPLTADQLGIESRSGGPTRLVLDFDEPVTAGPGFALGLSSGTGSAVFNGNQAIITLAGTTNGQVLNVQLSNVADLAGNVSSHGLRVGVLLGDVNADQAVNSTDVSLTKARSGQALGATNFRFDANISGTINVADVTLVVSRNGTAVINRAPTVSAGQDDSVLLPDLANLDGAVSDDGLPLPGTLTTQWTEVSGEGDVTFGDPAAVDTTASFSAPGTYTLRLTATDGGGLVGSDEVVIVVDAANQAPIVDAGDDIVVPTSDPTAALDGTVTDDGLSDPPTVTQQWTVVDGPGLVTFDDPSAVDTDATFAQPGVYVLQLTATDGDDLSAFDQVTVTVNTPPTVDAGFNTSVTIAESAELNGTAADDDALPGALTTEWELVEGPGTVTFGDAGDIDTTATFSTTGTYLLSLTASDSASSVADTVTITVTAATPPSSLTGTVSASPLRISTETSEKPQSKLWTYDNRWFGVFATTGGTFVFELVGNQWQSRLQLSASTTARADVKPVGGVAHVLLYNDDASQLASIQYTGAGNYQFWSQRPGLVSLPTSGADETATIDIDGDGRMWIAYTSGSNNNVHVQYSEAASNYATWSTPISLATGLAGDDIAAVVAFPNGSVGVMWSNQNTDRFGFRLHAPGTAPTSWSANEVPGNAAALNIGDGMADDHINVKVASNGTAYAAVKFSYDTDGQPIIGLLVRRPTGVWETHTVKTRVSSSNAGTRAVVVLNETTQSLVVAYTQQNNPNPILYRQSPMGTIAFGPEQTLINRQLNNVTSTKQNVSGDIVFGATESDGDMYAVHMPWGSSGVGSASSSLAAGPSLFSDTELASNADDLLLDELVVL